MTHIRKNLANGKLYNLWSESNFSFYGPVSRKRDHTNLHKSFKTFDKASRGNRFGGFDFVNVPDRRDDVRTLWDLLLGAQSHLQTAFAHLRAVEERTAEDTGMPSDHTYRLVADDEWQADR